MSRKSWFKLISVGGSILLVLLVVELGLRLYVLFTDKDPTAQLDQAEGTLPPPWSGSCESKEAQANLGELIVPDPAPDVMYRLKSNLDTCYVRARVQTNAAGYRQPRDFAQPKPAGVFRLLLLGDSMTFGQGVAYEETYGEHLRTHLQQQHGDRTIEVINTGVLGYNTAQEAGVLRSYGLAYEPDCILLLFIGNDFELPQFLLKPRFAFAVDRSFLVDTLLQRRAKPKRFADGVIHPELFHNDKGPAMERIAEQHRHLVGPTGYRQAMRSIADTAGNIPVVSFADYSPVADEVDINELRTYVTQLGIASPAFRFPAESKYWLTAKDHHVNPAGHRKLAERMIVALKEDGRCSPGRSQ